MNSIDRYLSQFGLSIKESQVYLALLSKGPNTILNLSKITRYNRTTVHVTVDSLTRKGLVSSVKKGLKRVLIADSPDKLRLILEEEKMKLANKESLLNETIGLIYQNIGELKFNTSSSVKLYEGVKSVSLLYDEILLKSREIRAYVNFSETKTFFPDNFTKFSNAIRSGVIVYDLYIDKATIDEFKERYNHENYYSKPLPNKILNGAMDYMIANNSIIIVYFLEEPKAIVIENRLLYENARNLFDLLWGLIK